MAHDIQFLSDYVEIRQLNASYNRIADAGDGEHYAQLFTEDGEFEIVGNRVYRGRADIAAACSTTRVTVHVTTEPEIEIDGNTARQRLRMISIFRAQDKSRNEFVASGWYTDELRRTQEGWRYYRRRAELDLELSEVFARMTLSDAFEARGRTAIR